MSFGGTHGTGGEIEQVLIRNKETHYIRLCDIDIPKIANIALILRDVLIYELYMKICYTSDAR